MRKFKKIMVNNSMDVLSPSQMRSIMGSSSAQSYHYFLRCNQDTTNGIFVSDCSNATFETYCGINSPYKGQYHSVCIETYY